MMRLRPRLLVHGQPHPMPQTMTEVVAVAGLGDQVARHGIDILAVHARSNRRLRRHLRGSTVL